MKGPHTLQCWANNTWVPELRSCSRGSSASHCVLVGMKSLWSSSVPLCECEYKEQLSRLFPIKE
ncbi:hypothetical protein HPG69_005573 [Diceros bicornis minor]|uniref:Uncharacterized protein n=1 Tax=Diceros bicornis minor TaxID=77932 RepID=A0A7J7EM13_DICBM|nr:hypothetical protein HPG69_005573 [Diceros bicornis minor]